MLDEATLKTWINGDDRFEHNNESSVSTEARSQASGLILSYAISLSKTERFRDLVRPSQERMCGRCQQPFDEWSLPYQFIERLGPDQLDFCSPCLRDTLLATGNRGGNDAASASEVEQYLIALATASGRVPAQSFGYNDPSSLLGLSTEDRRTVLDLFADRPSHAAVRRTHGSWFEALVATGLLGGAAQRGVFGTRNVAADGHVCLSLGERTIDDLLFRSGIHHEREPRYPEGNHRADFKVGTTLVEYLGLAGQPDYDRRTLLKREICRRHSIPLLCIEPKDLMDQDRLLQRLEKAAQS